LRTCGERDDLANRIAIRRACETKFDDPAAARRFNNGRCRVHRIETFSK
jgi:hypothetical protein